jgi:YD repeat-containing protein
MRFAFLALMFLVSLSSHAGYVYVEPKMLGYTHIPPGIVHFNSVQEANDAYLAYVTAANAHLPCPPKFTNPGPSPYSPSSTFDVNGIRNDWGAQYTAVGQSSNGSCYDGYTAWHTQAYLAPQCPTGIQISYTWLSETQAWATCAIYYPDEEPCDTCQVGNPVLVSNGEKIQVERDYAGPSGLDFTRTYRGSRGRFSTGQEQQMFILSDRAPLDGCLPAIYMHPQQAGPVPREHCFRYTGIGTQQYRMRDAQGRDRVFNGSPTAPTAPSYARERLYQSTNAQGLVSWNALREDNSFEVYSATGGLRTRMRHDGRSYITANLGNGVTTLSDDFGRVLRWERTPYGNVTRMVDPAGGIYSYDYDTHFNLTRVTYPQDGAAPPTSRQYHFESIYWTGSQGLAPLYQLTGITDEFGHRYATYVYAAGNRVASERHHVGGGVDVNSYTFNNRVVTDPLGTQRTYNFTNVQSYRQVFTGIAQPAGAGSPAVSSTLAYDTQANLTSRDDFNGKRTCYANDLSRNLETVRVEGLNAGASCAVTAVNATLPAGSRKVSRQWHPDWRLEAKVAEPGRIISSIYNGQPDPFNANALASCAPASALLPDGKPIAVVCKQVEQATTDTNGALGFTAALQAGVANRVSTWTYNQYGQVLTENGPRTDINDTTTYVYYSDTTADHTMGDLQTITNAAGRVTQYTKYNRHGQVLESIDPNGVVSTNTYDARMRLLSSTVAGQTTSYQYDLAGQLKRVTLPDQSWIGYDYDAAHRQTAVYDHKGNRIEYVLDNAGNRTGENTKDPSGALKRQLARSIDALGRVQQTTGRE